MDHLLGRFPYASNLWYKGVGFFHQSSRVRGRSNLITKEWKENPSQNAILNKTRQLFPSFLLWEIWRKHNQCIFREKIKMEEGVWSYVQCHIHKRFKLTPLIDQYLQSNDKKRIILQIQGIHSPPGFGVHGPRVGRHNPKVWSDLLPS